MTMSDDTFMRGGDNAFTLGLFDNSASPSRASPALSNASDLFEADVDDAKDTDAGDDIAMPAAPISRGGNFHLDGDRALASGWAARARDNIVAITLSKTLEQADRAPTKDEQAHLLRFIGFGATDLAQNCFRRPGETEFRPEWLEIGVALEAAVTPAEYAALQRATQYAHYTPEMIIRGLWCAAERLGFSGGHVLEPGMGTGLFFALLPKGLRGACDLTGIEYDPVTRPHRAPRAPRGGRMVRGLRAEQSDRALRSRNRQPAFLRPRGAGRSRHAILASTAA
jgi:hypothetical protein